MRVKSLSVIMPVYNEASTFEALLKKVLAVRLPLKKEIIIIESNSTDGTRGIARKYQRMKGLRDGIRVIYEQKPGGKGIAVRKGLKIARGDLVLIQDGDLEYDPKEYPLLIRPFLKENAQVVFGSRHLGMKKWKIRSYTKERAFAFFLNLGHVLYTSLFNILYGTDMTDPATMYKVFRRDLIRGVRFRTSGFDFDWELTAKLVKRGSRIREVAVSYRSRGRAEGKKIRFFRDGIRVFMAIIRFRLSD
jgi:glycosyltransferase involved in cell wall biosynthesis